MTDTTNAPPSTDRNLLADRARELMVLNAVAAAVAESLEPRPLLILALDHVLDLLEFNAGAIYTRDDDGRLQLVVARGVTPAVQQRYAELPLNNPAISRILHERKALQIDDVRTVGGFEVLANEAGLFALLGLPLIARGEVAGVLMILRDKVQTFGARELTLIEAVADHIALALDNARLYAAEQQRRRQSEALRKGALALTEPLAPDAVLQRIVEQATELMETPMCAIYEFDGEAEQLNVRTSAGHSAATSTWSAAIGRHIIAAAIAAQHAISVADVAEVAWERELGLATLPPPSEQRGFRSILAAPMLVKGRVYGGLVVYYAEQRTFSADEVQLIDIFADQAALALEHARLVSQSRQLAAIEERQRIARDLHDSVTQTLFSLNLAAEAARTTVLTDVAAATSMLNMVQELASGALAEMRALIFELRPGALHEAGLAAAIERFVGAFRSRTALQIALDLDSRRLPLPVEEALYRITCEALANVGKHARASQVDITLRQQPASVELAVHDNGIGFDPEQPVTGDHMGQRTMQERAAALGGACRVESGRGRGTTVTVTVPVNIEH
jgi:signal transduction histidine kinase